MGANGLLASGLVPNYARLWLLRGMLLGMPTTTGPTALYRSSIPWFQERVGAAAIYCADGRYNDQTDDFLHNHLGLPRYDRVVIPGGAACLAGHTLAMRERGAFEKQLRFLVESHELRRIVLIAHEDCGFYRHLLRARGPLEPMQAKDLLAVAGVIRTWSQGLAVDAYFARKSGDSVQFEPVR
jgi:hypothetical protein